MPTIQEQARQREIEKLRRAGLDEDGNPLDPNADGPTPAMRLSAQAGDGDGDGDGDGGNANTNEPDMTARLQEELAQVRRELAAANGRAAPSQQQAAEYQRLWAESEAARRREAELRDQQIAALQQQLDERNNAFDPAELLDEDERNAIEPELLNTVAKLADKIAQRRMPQVDVRAEVLRVQQERAIQEVNEHRQRALTDPGRGLHKLAEYAYDPQFIEWSNDEDNDINSVVNSLLEAKSTGEVDRYAKMVAKRLAKFAEHKAGGHQPTDTRGALGSHMRRAEKPRMTEAEVNSKLAEAKRLARSSSKADRDRAQQIINDIK